MTLGRMLLASTVTIGLVAALGCATGDPECKEGTVARGTECVAVEDTGNLDSADADTDADTGLSGFTGSVTYLTTVDGEPGCDVTARLTGTPYAGACEDCEFSLELDSEIMRDDSTQCGSYATGYTFIADEGWSNLVVEYAPEYLLWGMYEIENVFISRYTYDGYDGYRFIYFTYNDAPYGYGEFSRRGDEFTWSYSTEVYGMANYAYCGTLYASYATEGYGGASATSSLNCDSTDLDVWTFVAAETEATVTVDTVGPDSAFDPYFWVNGPSGCAMSLADDNFTCAFPPPTYSCPSAELTDLSVGEYYEVVVGSHNDCAGSTAEYELRVDGGARLTLVEDGSATTQTTTYDVSGEGTLLYQ